MAKSNKFILGRCTYDPETRTIRGDSASDHVIGHVQAKLLELLYSDPKVYYSNKDLQREVWNNRYIENTTIRTTVSYLRKALAESEECQYIESGRNKGYRFVAHIEEISTPWRLRKFLPSTIIASLVALLIYILSVINAPLIIPQIQTTLLGQELSATVSGELLVFSHKPLGEKYWNLYSKQLGKERYYQLTDGKHNDINAVFSNNGNQLAFNRYDDSVCKVIIADVDRITMQLKAPKTIFNCLDEPLSVSIAWKDENNLFLSYTDSMSKPYQIHSYNIQSGESIPITSPPATGRGDYYVTNSLDSSKTVFLRNIGASKTEIWIYDGLTNKSTKIASIPLVLMSAAWLESEKKLVLRTGDGELSTLNLDNNKLELLFRANYPIYYPYATNRQTIGYMRGSPWRNDIISLSLSGRSENIITSSFDDYRPTFAQDSKDIAFVSNRTGRSQIWLLKKEGELHQLTKFDDSFKIADLAISNNGKSIAFTTNTQLHIISDTGELKFSSSKDNIYKNPVFSNDGMSIYYSVNDNDNDKWFIESQSLIQLSEKKVLTEGYVVIPCGTEDCFYFTRFNGQLLYKSINNESTYTGVVLSDIENSNQLAIASDTIYYIHKNNNEPEILSQNLKSKKITNIMKLSTSRFSIQQEPLRFLTSIRRESETNLETIKIPN